ncbi:MAG TPA: phospho-N-acetylmuramoyl-pentapeptide-transferase [Caldisericia bacterium]|nr:phospho-N-acetylmuramoyl-pentapeptide-transferase [Caldisericia bacterium]HPF48234.1 phospho-N-acetylmuramoyl-pentapeptide-transferase [Caldisericia bacterium]HPI83830.1 phospho-N-acetylmuramoyl-pentapeptide-transferase [Caldisericia bacterium]HPQ92687.1 phospho-N-acetylmuramoyl-pentapeptide-transferase [Caldisericia bacterium]HRV74215.1 phospho-N-acetylmuramoyl-pentapeptide-transferase [Caldisericia bacterium]
MTDVLILSGSTFIIALAVGWPIVLLLRKIGTGQKVREESPEGHHKKSGTPCMGGFIFMLPVTFVGLYIYFTNHSTLITGFAHHYIFWGLYGLWAFGIIGFIDDYIKVYSKSPQGLPGRWTVMLQVLAALPFLFINYSNPNFLPPVFGPGTPDSLNAMLYLVAIIGTVNAVNLADGLDGLSAGMSAVTFTAMMPILFTVDTGIAIVPLILIGGLVAFLFFNFNPAKVWMGDTGSNAIGGLLAITAIFSKNIWIFVIAALLFVFEALSTIIQTSYFKLTKKLSGTGKRVFLMTPIHHHFELLGWSERKIVITFWAVSAVFGALALAIFYFL